MKKILSIYFIYFFSFYAVASPPQASESREQNCPERVLEEQDFIKEFYAKHPEHRESCSVSIDDVSYFNPQDLRDSYKRKKGLVLGATISISIGLFISTLALSLIVVSGDDYRSFYDQHNRLSSSLATVTAVLTPITLITGGIAYRRFFWITRMIEFVYLSQQERGSLPYAWDISYRLRNTFEEGFSSENRRSIRTLKEAAESGLLDLENLRKVGSFPFHTDFVSRNICPCFVYPPPLKKVLKALSEWDKKRTEEAKEQKTPL